MIDSRFNKLTVKQKELAELAQQNGSISIIESRRIYNSVDSATNAIKKLVQYNIIKISNRGGHFEYIKE